MRPTHTDPLFILAMDHRDSFGKTLFHVDHDDPTDEQRAAMERAKQLIYAGLRDAQPHLASGRAGVLVDERYGAAVIAAAQQDPGVTLAVPIEASGHEWFTLEWGEQWADHLREVRPDYAKVLVRDNPTFDPDDRTRQLERLATVSAGLHELGVPLLYELLVPATDEQLAGVNGDKDVYDRDIRPDLVVQVIADNQHAGVEPTLWKVEGLDTREAAERVAAQARADGRDADLIVLGRDAPVERLDTWLDIAAGVEAFVGFAIGRSIWEDVVRDVVDHGLDDETARTRVSERYLGFASRWS